MRKLLYIIVTTVVLAACTDNGKERAALDAAQAVINRRPDSALAILDSLEPSSHGFSRPTLRRWQLLRLMAQNKCDTVFRSDSLQLILTGYYDRHGSPNEKMWAHYLLGRAYSDMGEAPRALQCFQDAAACADTTALHCDFRTLFLVYGQMAMVYRSQCMPYEEMAAWNHYSHYAKKSGDIYSYIRGIEMTIGPYYDMGDTLACLRITEQCRREYVRHGMIQKAASVFPTAIYIHLQNSNYDKAKEMMRKFERESGLFDSSGNIEKGRETYYYSKGIYYLGIHESDSAELYFRKLSEIRLNHDYLANKGLLSLYHHLHKTDSISKYTALFEKSVDDILSENQTDAVAQAAAYNKYIRLQKESKIMAVKAEKSKWLSRMLFVGFVLIIAVLAYFFIHYKRKQKAKMEKLGLDYTNIMAKYRKACLEAKKMNSDKNEAMKEKEDEIGRLKFQLDGLRNIYEGLSPDMKKAVLSKSDIVKKFKSMAIPSRSQILPSKTEWKLLIETIEFANPALYGKIFVSCKLSQQEIYTAILTWLHFSNDELGILISASKQRITNLKSSTNLKLFGMNTARSLQRNIELFPNN